MSLLARTQARAEGFPSEIPKGEEVKIIHSEAVGLAGLRKQLKFLTASDGHDIDSPDFFALNARRIKSKHRRLSRKKRGSRNYERARLDLDRAYRKLVNQRKDFHFKLANMLCRKYSVICLENLNTRSMARHQKHRCRLVDSAIP